jgi:hypothetical protein
MITDDGIANVTDDMFQLPIHDNYYESIVRIRMSIDESFRIKKHGINITTTPVFCSREMFYEILKKIGENNIKRSTKVKKCKCRLLFLTMYNIYMLHQLT